MTKEELFAIRQSLGLSKTEFAVKLGITQMMEGRYESGGVEIPERVAVIAEGLVPSKPKRGRKKAAASPVTSEKPKGAEKADVQIIIQSRMGGEISIDEILTRLPSAGVEKVYIKPEENRAYWVSEDSAGSVELW